MKLVCLPGLDGTGVFFEAFVAALPAEVTAQVVRYPRDEALGYDALLARVEAQLPRDEPFVLLGESFSGPLALRLAAKAPVGLRGLVLVATFHRRATDGVLGAAQRLLRAPMFSLSLPRVAVRALLAGDDAPVALVDQFRAEVKTVWPEVLALRVHETGAVDASAAARACRVPALYLAARKERLIRRGVLDELKGLMPRLEVVWFDTAHLVLQREPVEAARVVARFVSARSRSEESGGLANSSAGGSGGG